MFYEKTADSPKCERSDLLFRNLASAFFLYVTATHCAPLRIDLLCFRKKGTTGTHPNDYACPHTWTAADNKPCAVCRRVHGFPAGSCGAIAGCWMGQRRWLPLRPQWSLWRRRCLRPSSMLLQDSPDRMLHSAPFIHPRLNFSLVHTPF